MVLESTMICFDNSDYQRNGDYYPTRLNVQKDGINLVCLTKVRSNPENNVGLMTISNTVEVLATLTSDVGKIFSKMHLVQPKGDINLVIGVRIAHLVLKHRQGKNHKMRIVAFVGSPINTNEAEMVKLAKRLKKEKVSVDIVSFGDHVDNNEVLTGFINALNGKDGSGSHLVIVPRGSVFSDALLSSPIIQGEDGMGGAGLGGSGFEFGVDPNEDPELALALRVSMEEQRQRQEDEQRRAMADSNSTATPSAGGQAEKGLGSDKAGVALTPAAADHTSEEAMLQRALALSTDTDEDNMPDFANMSEEEQIAFAMQMSMEDAAEEVPVTYRPKRPKTEGDKTMEVDDDYGEVISDPDFLQRVLGNLPGVDADSDDVRSVSDPNNAEKKSPDEEPKKK